MENKKLVKFIISFITLALFGSFLFLQKAQSYDSKCGHIKLTENIAQIYNQYIEPDLSPKQIAWLKWGAEHEDTPVRYLNHFYDPINNRGWANQLTTKQWSQDSVRQSLPGFFGDYSWHKAIYEYQQGNQEYAYKALGHILHLMQDMSVPDHTRDDTHLPSEGTESPYEKWVEKYCVTNNFGFTGELVIYDNLNAYFDNLAKYSNNYFYSADSIGKGKYENPKNPKDLKDDEKYVYGLDENGIEFKLAKIDKLGDWRNIVTRSIYTLNDAIVLNGYFQRLGPKAVQYGAGVIYLFHQEAAKQKKEKSTLAIITTTLEPATVNTPYSAPLTATGGKPPYEWSLSNNSSPLPPRLLINKKGIIEGTPTQSGTYNFTVEAKDSSGGWFGVDEKISQALSLVIQVDPATNACGTPFGSPQEEVSIAKTIRDGYRQYYNIKEQSTDSQRVRVKIIWDSILAKIQLDCRQRALQKHGGWELSIIVNPLVGRDAYSSGAGIIDFGYFEYKGVPLNDDEIAFILSHEIAHSLLDHTPIFILRADLLSGIRSRIIINVAGPLCDRGIKKYCEVVELVDKLERKVFSREQEAAADSFALSYMSAAGFDIERGAVSLLQKWVADETDTQAIKNDYSEAHPSDKSRLNSVLRRLGKLLPPAPQTLTASLSASPSSITAGQSVALKADVGGTAQGTIHYQFDCTNNGSYEVDVTNTTNPYTTNSCNYSSPGTYTARVHVEQGTALPAEDTVRITVTVACTPNWQTESWGTCTNGQQTRTVTDSNNCGTTTNKPPTTQSCTVTCTPQWQTGAWSACVNGQQTRTVADSNNCGVTTNKPSLTQSCTATCTPKWSCGSWSTCINNQQARTCVDANNCGTTVGVPSLIQSCSLTPPPTNQVDISTDGNLTITRGQTGTKTVTANISAWENKSVSFKASGLPSGASGTFSPQSCDKFCNTTLAITVSPTTAFGSYEIDITATRENVNDGARFTLTIESQTIPGAPENLTTTALSSSQIQLNWIDMADNENVVRIERTIGKSAMANPDQPIIYNERVSNKISHTDTGLQPSTEYCYRVYFLNEDNQSDYSNVACAETQAGAPPPPALKPDLIVASITAPAEGIIGGLLSNVSITFKNQGQGDIVANRFRTAFFWSSDATINQNDVVSGQIVGFTQGIPAGESRTVSLAESLATIPVPSSLSANVYYLGAIADYYGEIDEESDQNNTGASAPIALVAPSIGPQLISPSNGSTISGSSYAFAWQASGYVSIKFFNGAGCSGTAMSMSGTSNNSYQWQLTSDFAKGQTYSWQIIKYVDSAPSFSACWSFSIVP